MSIIQINKNDKTTIINLEPVEKYESLLEDACQNGKAFSPNQLFELANSMNADQLRHLVSILTSLAEHYARLWRFSFTEAHTEQVSQLRKLKQMVKAAGMDIWPELG